MALSLPSLQSALQSALATAQPSAAAAANALATAYDDYAAAGLFGSSVPTLAGKKAAMVSALTAGLATPGTPANFAGAWASAVAAYWTAVPVAGAQSGVTNGCPGAASLTATLTTLFSNTANTVSTAASSLGSALHAATLTTTATVAPPPGTVLPLL